MANFMKVLDPTVQIRDSCGYVVSNASRVSINLENLKRYAEELKTLNFAEVRNSVQWDACGWHYCQDVTSLGKITCQYVFVMDALNFCFWPTEGLEYDTLAVSLREVLEKDPSAFDGNKLAVLDKIELLSWFPANLPLPNIDERILRINELGACLATNFDNYAYNMVVAAKNSAVALVELILRYLPGFRDTSIYQGRLVHLYKRAQILVGDLWAAYGRSIDGSNVFSFPDIGKLTMFADYRVPQILRAMKVLEYSEELSSKIDSKQEIPFGSPEEIEIRAATVIAVDLLQTELVQKGIDILVIELDWLLWQIGEKMKDELQPHHRTLTIYY